MNRDATHVLPAKDKKNNFQLCHWSEIWPMKFEIEKIRSNDDIKPCIQSFVKNPCNFISKDMFKLIVLLVGLSLVLAGKNALFSHF